MRNIRTESRITLTLEKWEKELVSTIEAIQNRFGHAAHSKFLLAAGFGVLILFSALTFLSIGFISDKSAFLNEQLENHEWKMPSTVYANAPVLEPGKRVTQKWLVDYLHRLDYQDAKSTVKTGQYLVRENAVSIRKRFLTDENDKDQVLISFTSKGISEIKNLGSNLRMSSYELEPLPLNSLFGSEYEKRTLVSFSDLPPHLIRAVIAIEDRRFFKHSGIDGKGILRALRSNFSKDNHLQGASTITQQLVKNFYLNPERTMKRKINEAVLAVLLERKLSKEKILELYLNEIYLGQRGPVSVNGVGEASRLYFRKDVRDLSVVEAALLAGLIQAPQRHNPYQHPENALNRRNKVLLAMKTEEYITEQQFQDYSNAPLGVQTFDATVARAPYFGEIVKTQVEQALGSEEMHSGNFRVFTTLDIDMQEAAEKAISEGLADIDRIRSKKTHKEAQACLIAIDPSTGEIKAFVGGKNFSKSQFDRITQATRQPGSSFKPFIYAAAIESAFESGAQLTPASLISDEPLVVQFGSQTWQPQNYDGSYNGTVTLRRALAQSMNIATARLAQEVGLDKIVRLSKNIGFQNVMPYPSVSLGAFEVSPWQMVKAYTVFANGGVETELNSIKKIVNSKGDTVQESKTRSRRVLHPETAYLITTMLKSVMTEGTGASIRRWNLNQVVAGKTGTTNDYKDAWFIGYTPDLICLVWTGYDDNTPLRMTGAQAALPIWARFMKSIHGKMQSGEFETPQGLVTREIDSYTGKLASDHCAHVITEVFVEGTEPQETCNDYLHSMPLEYVTANYDLSMTPASDSVLPKLDRAEIYAVKDSKGVVFTNIDQH